MTTTTIDNGFAVDVADYIQENLFAPHRGVVRVFNPAGGEDFVVAFGNDAYQGDERTRLYADRLERLLRNRFGNATLGIDSGDQRYTWAIVVAPTGGRKARFMVEEVEALLYRCFQEARGIAEGDGMVWLMAKIHRREIIDRTGGEPLSV
jgi:hypothetical protein